MLLLLLTACTIITDHAIDGKLGVAGDSGLRACNDPNDQDCDGYAVATGDCDDTDPAVNPGATEVCRNALDDNCDASADGCALGDITLDSADAGFSGAATYDYAGESVTIAGDVNGDGFDDMVVGADQNNTGPGEAYLVLGGASPASEGLSAALVYPGNEGSGAGDIAGQVVAGAGDFNGDGYDDFLVGDSQNDRAGEDAGLVYLVFGSAGPTGGELSGASAFTGEAALDYAGRKVSGAGDVNGDGFGDFLVGAYCNGDAGSQAGMAYLVLGSGSSDPSEGLYSAIKYAGEAPGDRVEPVAGGGDADGDGLDDMLISAPYAPAPDETGIVYLVLGSAGPASESLSAADAIFTDDASNEYNGVGQALAMGGDVDGDGYADMLVGAPRDPDGGMGAGAVMLFRGSAVPASDRFSTADAILTGELPNAGAGSSVAALGDIDNDGFDDFAIGAPGTIIDQATVGAAYVVRGSAAPASGSLGDADARIAGVATSEAHVWTVGGGGDVNGDGYDDVLIGAMGSPSYAGAAYLILGTGI